MPDSTVLEFRQNLFVNEWPLQILKTGIVGRPVMCESAAKKGKDLQRQ